jgi:glycosyltransferase involved in cell wall biosynthesis
MVSHDVNGILVEDRDPDTNAHLIINLFQDRKRYAMLSNACFQSYKQKFNWQKWANDFYKTVIIE